MHVQPVLDVLLRIGEQDPAALLGILARAEIPLDFLFSKPDLAGRVLCFTNPQPKEGAIEGLASEQHGAVGDITASRRVRVPGCPPGEMKRLRGAGEPCPWRWANALHLEWFGTRNGRVVIESSDYQLGKKQTPTKSGQGQTPTRPRTVSHAIFLAKR